MPADHADERFCHDRYVIRQKIITFIGAAFHVYGPDGQVVLYSRQKAFRLREDVRLYTGEDMQQEVLRIKARQIIDFGATYDVTDSASGAVIGSLRRRGFKSMMRDEWTILDAEGRETATILEDSAGLAILRRMIGLVTLFIPQRYQVEMNGRVIGRYVRRRNPFVHKVEVDFSEDAEVGLDPRLAVVGGLLLCAVERRQQS